jgi:dihydroneopterin aldolase
VTLVIELHGLELHGHHGVLEEERRAGQRFLVDLELEPADPAAAVTDRIEDAVDYRDVVALVEAVSGAHAYQLLEAFAAAIADELLRGLPLRRVRVRVRKPDVALTVPAEYAAVVVVRDVSER